MSVKSLVSSKVLQVIVLISLFAIVFSSYSVADETDVIVSFGLMADIHYSDRPDEPDRVRYFRTSLQNVKEAVEIFNEVGVDFIVSLGDSVQESADKFSTIDDLRRLDKELSKFNGDLHYVIGNHDLVRLTREDFLENTSGAVNHANYFFDKEGYRFIVLDANWPPNYTIHETVVLWLEERLVEAKEKDHQAIIFVHQGLDNRDHDHVIKNAVEVREVFKRVGNVFAVFQGHTHPGGYWNVDGVHYLGIQALINYPFPTFAIATIYEDGVDIEGYGAHRHGWMPK